MSIRFSFLILILCSFTSANAGVVVLNGLTHTYKVAKGKVYKGKVEIENTGNSPQSVKFYLQDFAYKADGTSIYSAINTNKRSNSNWITLNTNLLTLRGKEKTTIVYEIKLPEGISASGSFWSVLMVEPVDDIQPNNDKIGVSVTSVVRYAIQIITDYQSEHTSSELKFESVSVEKVDDKQFVKVAIANNGNLFCKTIAAIEIYNRTTAEKMGTFTSVPMGLLPDMSKSFHIDISKLPPDSYNATIIATDEQDNAFAINVELDIKND